MSEQQKESSQDIWKKTSDRSITNYHLAQFEKPYRSTEKLVEYLEQQGVLQSTKTLLDIGCGTGANMYYMSKRYPGIRYIGLDLNPELIDIGKERLADEKNITIDVGDAYLVHEAGHQADGMISIHLLLSLPDYEKPLDSWLRLKPEWLAINTLAYPGPVEAEVKVKDYTDILKDGDSAWYYYNVLSLDRLREYFDRKGYDLEFEEFVIDIDLAKPDSGGLGAYTITAADGKRLQFTGPLAFPWYFILARRRKG